MPISQSRIQDLLLEIEALQLECRALRAGITAASAPGGDPALLTSILETTLLTTAATPTPAYYRERAHYDLTHKRNDRVKRWQRARRHAQPEEPPA